MRLIFTFLTVFLFAPMLLVSQASAQDSYRIRPGDVLRIEVLEDPSMNRASLVSPDGRITMPLAGQVKASGRSIEDVQAELSQRMAGNFASPPNIFVSLEKLAEPRASGGNGTKAVTTVDIYIMGEVAKPGKLAVERGTTMLQLFAEMGGFSKFAATKRIQLRRVGKDGVEKSYVFNYDAIEQGASKSGATVVQKGDVILVPQRRLFE